MKKVIMVSGIFLAVFFIAIMSLAALAGALLGQKEAPPVIVKVDKVYLTVPGDSRQRTAAVAISVLVEKNNEQIIRKNEAKIREGAMMTLSRRSPDLIRISASTGMLQNELKGVFNSSLGADVISKVYISELSFID